MFSTDDGKLLHDGKVVGPASALYVDSSELREVGREDGVIRAQTPHRIDMVFVAGDKTVGVESKRPQDLIDSTRNRRLARQVRKLMVEVDVPVLLLRGGTPLVDRSLLPVMLNLVNLQRLGVLVYPVPTPDWAVVPFLEQLRASIASDKSVYSAVAGTDTRKTPPKSLLQLIKGIGPETERKLVGHFGDVTRVLLATSDELVDAGLSQRTADLLTSLVAGGSVEE